MLEVRSDELATHYRVEVWAEHLSRWVPADLEGDIWSDVVDELMNLMRDDPEDGPLHDPAARRIVACRETVVPWPEGAADAR